MKRLIAVAIAFLTLISTDIEVQAEGWPANYGGVMLQGFYWDAYTESSWNTLTANADELAGYFDIIWVPNAGQSDGSPSMGYIPQYWFSRYDNCSFGSESQLRNMISTFRNKRVSVIMDLVINHRGSVGSWYSFPAETWKGTTYQLDGSCICSTDEVNRTYPGSATGAPDEGDDFDGARDLDHTNAKVQNAVKAYCDFLLQDLGFSGFRLDMVKGYAGYYTKMYNQHSHPRFSVGEYWDGYDNITGWIDATGKESAAFDFPFKYALNDAFNGGGCDASKLSWLAGANPQPAGIVHNNYKQYAVTFIDNHDTYRDGSKFTGNVLAAHAMMLCSPGTPCVFLAHWNNASYKPQIKKMIAIRKACGVTNTSRVDVYRHDSSCYMAVVHGSKGNLAVKIGSAQVSPSGFSDSQIKASGTDWCIWADVNVPDTPGTIDRGAYTVYWDNSSAAWTTPKVHYFGGESASEWPGVAMTKVAGTNNVYKYTVPNGTTGLVFNNGSGSKTDDLVGEPSHIYGLTGDKGAYSESQGDIGGSTTDPGDEGQDTGSNMTVYFDNRVKNWPSVYYYTASMTWPGTKITTSPVNNIYKCEIPKSTSMVIFNNGNGGDDNQTADLTPTANHIYYHRAGDDGSILPSKIYVIGTLDKQWDPSYGVELTKSGNVYRGLVTLRAATEGTNAYFSFVQQLSSSSSSWDACNGKHRYGPTTSDATVTVGTPITLATFAKSGNPGGANSFKAAPGTYYMTADFNNMQLTLQALSLRLNKEVITLAPGETTTVTATAEPEDIGGLSVSWTSADETVATVSATGKVTGVGKGETTVTADFGGLTASCTVIVGKTSQTIMWTQTLDEMQVGDTQRLQATASSSLPVSFAVTSGNSVVSIADGMLTANAPGVATIQARQPGDDDYAPANPVSKTITVKLDYTPGDVLGNNGIDVDDVTAVVHYILGMPIIIDGETVTINTRAADINGDGSIDVVDVTILMGIVLDSAQTRVIRGKFGTLTIDDEGEAQVLTPDGNCILKCRLRR